MFYTYILITVNLFTFCECSEYTQIIPDCPQNFPQPSHLKSADDAIYSNSKRCNFTMISPEKIINPYKRDHRPARPFGNVCIKCAACFAIADEITFVMSETLRNLKEHPMENIHGELSRSVKELCENGFKNFDLRKFREIELITNRLKCTRHVNSGVDGTWTKKLRELCHFYHSHLNLEDLIDGNEVTLEYGVQMLCSGAGIFRDCQNLEYDLLQVANSLRKCRKSCQCNN